MAEIKKIQEIRARQAMEEVGMKGDIRIEHSENPKTFIKGKEYSLVFPRFILDIRSKKSPNTFMFIGLVTDKRKEFLSNFENATILNSDRGRKQETKEKDLPYFRMMARSQFVLCPDGDFVWTYRFFEAILCRAIPIIENNCSLYKGYHFYTVGDRYIYRKDWVKANISKMKEEMML